MEVRKGEEISGNGNDGKHNRWSSEGWGDA